MPTIADPAGNQGLEAGTHMSMYTLYISILCYSIFCIYMQLQLCMFGIHKTDTTTPTDTCTGRRDRSYTQQYGRHVIVAWNATIWRFQWGGFFFH